MTIEVKTGLEELVKESAVASRVTNALLLAQAMNLDVTKPLEAKKVLRHLALVERAVRTDTDE